MLTLPEAALQNGEITGAQLSDILTRHAQALPRYARLRSYYLNQNDILSRTRAPGLPNHCVPHAFARYIVLVTSGYLVGESVGYKTDDKNREALDALLSCYRESDIPSVDIENARNAAIYGKGVELVTVQGGRPKSYALSPENAFVVYSDSIAHEPLLGVCLCRTDGGEDAQVLCYSKDSISSYTLIGNSWMLSSRQPHYLGGVPMVEFWNDEREMGDFEWVVPLIDAYDALQSDRINDKDQFADKLLVLTGCTLDTDESGRPPWLQLRQDRALCLPDSDASAQYLSGEMNEAGNEILRSSLESDIHKLSLVPDLSDKSFSGNVSGVAMKYKLMGLEMLCGLKQQWFTEGLKARLKLYAHHLSLTGQKPLDPSRVVPSFTRTLPESLSETAELIKTAGEAGAMSTRTMVETLHKNADWDETMIKRELDALTTPPNKL